MAFNVARSADKDARLQVIITALSTAGVLKIYSSGYTTLLATFPLANPAGTIGAGSGSTRVLTFNTFPNTDAVPDANGTAALARLEQGGGTVIADGLTVGTSGTDIVLSSTTISTAVPITLSSATLTHP